MSDDRKEKVVSLRFENDQFESKVQQSLSTLEKLKNSLNFKADIKGFDNLNKTIKASDFSSMAQGVENVSNRFSNLGIVGMTVVQRMTNAAIDFGKKAAKLLTAPIQQMKTGGFNRANVIDQARYKIRGLGMDWKQVREDALYAVEGTAYGLAEAADVAASLGASGVKMGKDMKQSLLAISGAAAQTGRSYSDIGNIFTTVASNGKLMTMQLRQFSASGLNVSALLAKEMGRSEEEINQMVTKGMISYEEFAYYMNKKFGPNAKKANDTYAGSLENVKAALNRVGAAFYEPGIEFMRNVFVDLIPLIDEIKASIGPLTKRFEIFTTAFVKADGVKIFFDTIREGMSLIGSLNRPVQQAYQNVFGPLKELPKAKRGMKAYIDQFKEYAKVTKTIVDENGKEKTVRTYDDNTIYTALNIADQLKTKLEQIKKSIREYKPSETVINNLGSVFQGLFAAANIAGNAIKAFGKLLLPIGGLSFSVAGAIGRVIGYLNDFARESGIFSAIFEIVDHIGDRVGEVSKAFSNLFSFDKGSILIEDLNNFMMGFVPEEAIRNIKDIFSAFVDVLKLAGEVVAGVIKSLLPLGRIIGAIGSVLLNVVGSIARFISMGLKWISKSRLVSTAFNIVSKAINLFAKAVSFIIRNVGLFISKVMDLGTKYLNTFISILAAVIKSLTELGLWLGSKIYSLITTYAVPAFDKLRNGIGSTVSKIKEYITHSKLYQKAQEGISKGTNVAKTAFSTAKDKFAELIGKVKESNAFDKLKDSLSKLRDVLKEMASNAISSIASWFSNIVASIKELHIIDKIASGFKFLVDHVTKFITYLKDNLHPIESLKKVIDPEMFQQMGKSVAYAAGNIKELAQSGELLSGRRASGGAKSLTDTFKKLYEIVQNLFKNNKITDIIAQFKSKLLGLDVDQTIDRGIGITKIIATLKLVRQSGKIANSLSFGLNNLFNRVNGLIQAITNTISSFGGLTSSLTSLSDTARRALKVQTFKMVAVSIGIIAGSLFVISKIPTDKAVSSLKIMGGIVAAMIALIVAINKTDLDSGKVQAMALSFAGLGASLLMIAISAAMFAKMKPSDLIKSGIALGAYIFALTKAAIAAGKIGGKSMVSFLAIATAVGILVPTIILMSRMEFDTLVKGGAAIFAFIVMMGLAGRAASQNKSGFLGFIGISAAVTAMIPAIIMLALLPFGRAMKAAVALGVIMINLGLALRIAGQAAGSAFTAVAIGASVVALTGALVTLALIPFGRLAKAVAALSATMLTLAATARLMGTQKKSIISMTLIFGLIAGSVYLLSTIKTDVALQSMAGIAALLLAVAYSFKILEKIKVTGQLVSAALAALLYMDAVIVNTMAIAAAIGAVSKEFKGLKPAMEEGIEIINLVGKFLGSLVNGLINGILGNFGDGSNRLSAVFKQFTKDIAEGLDNFKGIDSSTVSAAKNVAEALMYITAAEFLNNLNSPLWGDSSMVHFAKEFKTFTDELAKVDLSSFDENTSSQMTLVGNIIKGLGEAAMKIPSQGGLSGLITGSKDLGVLADQLFGDNGFVTKLRGYKVFSGMFGSNVDKNLEKEMDTVGNIIKALGGAAQKVPTGFSAKAILVGMPDMVLLAEQLFGPNGFMPQITKYLNESKNAKGKVDTGITSDAKKQLIMVADVVGALGEAAGKISTNIDPDSVKAVYTGAVDLVKFAEGIGEIGKVMPSLISNSANMNEDAKKRIILMTDVIKELAKAAKVIDNLGVSEIGMNAGSNAGGGGAIGNSITSLAGFAEKLKDFIPKFKEFATQAAQISEGDLKAGSIVATATKNLAYAAKAMEEGGSKVSTKDWENLAKGVKTFAKEINGIETEKLAANAKALSDSIKTVTKTLSSKETKDGFKSAGKASIDAYIKGLENVKADSMISKGNAVAKNFVTGLNQRKKGEGSAYNAGKNTVGWYKEAASKVDGVKKTGNEVAKKFVNGLNSRKKGEGSAWNSGKYTVYQYKEGAKAGKEDYDIYSIGQNIAEGLINGMNSKKEDAYNAGFSLGQQSAKGTKDGAETNSPSKLTIPVGESIGEGLVVGMNSYANKVYKASSSMGETAALSVNSALGMNMMGDLGEPTIKPVIDLTNIERGARQIDGIITNSTGNINPYLLSQDINRQNGVNENMILANKIDKLASNMSNTGAQQSTNYSIGDVTLEVSSLQDVTTLNQFVDIIKRAKAFN